MVADFDLVIGVMLNSFARHDVSQFGGGLQSTGESRGDANRVAIGNNRIRDARCVFSAHAGDYKIDRGSSDVGAMRGHAADGHFFHVQRAPGGEFRFDRVSDENIHRNIVCLRGDGVRHAFDASTADVAVFFVPTDGTFECCRYRFGAKAQFFLRAGAIHKH